MVLCLLVLWFFFFFFFFVLFFVCLQFARLASRYEIDTDLVLPKVCYLVLTGAFGALLPFLPVFYDAIGIPIEQIGLLGAIRPFITFLSAPLWALGVQHSQYNKYSPNKCANSEQLPTDLNFRNRCYWLPLLLLLV
jgi:hypothetical protein